MQYLIKHLAFLFVCGILGLTACDKLAVEDSLHGLEYELTDQYGNTVSFPGSYEGNVMLVSYVYTYCPDICPMITFNMRDIQHAISESDNFLLVSVSFDPMRDTPEILYDYANNYRLDQTNWRLLTGERGEVEELLKKLKVQTVKTPTRFADDGRPVYFIDHTDRITLIDHKGNVRRNYPGSDVNSEQVVLDVKQLLSEINL